MLTLASFVVAEGAAAHIEIEPREAPVAETVQLVFSAKNEEVDAGTIKIQVQFPRKYPIASATPADDQLWQAEVTTRKVKSRFPGPDGPTRTAVDQVIFEGGPSPTVGTFELPAITVGPLPKKVARLYFKVLQTYANGQIARWIELPTDDYPRPETPAPSLALIKQVN